jgi:hypothetical protein
VSYWGCGVTSFDKEDAVRILKDKVFASHALPEIEAIVADIEIATQQNRQRKASRTRRSQP